MNFTVFDVPAIRRALEANQLGIAMSFGLTGAMDISSNDLECMARAERHLPDTITLARDVSATHVCGILYSAFRKYQTPPTEDGIARSVDVTRRVAELAPASGIILGMESSTRMRQMCSTPCVGLSLFVTA